MAIAMRLKPTRRSVGVKPPRRRWRRDGRQRPTSLQTRADRRRAGDHRVPGLRPCSLTSREVELLLEDPVRTALGVLVEGVERDDLLAGVTVRVEVEVADDGGVLDRSDRPPPREVLAHAAMSDAGVRPVQGVDDDLRAGVARRAVAGRLGAVLGLVPRRELGSRPGKSPTAAAVAKEFLASSPARFRNESFVAAEPS